MQFLSAQLNENAKPKLSINVKVKSDKIDSSRVTVRDILFVKDENK